MIVPTYTCRWHSEQSTSLLASSPHTPPPLLPGEMPFSGRQGQRTRHLLCFKPANVGCCDCPCCHLHAAPSPRGSAPHGAWLQATSPSWGPEINWTAAALKQHVCSLAGCRAGGSGESRRTPAEILYSWGRLAFSTRQDPLPCSNIPSLPLGKPADEISIAVTPDKPFPRAWQGGRAALRHGPWRKEGVQLPKGIPMDPQPQEEAGA